MKTHNSLQITLATLALAAFFTQVAHAQTIITDDFTDPTQWGPPLASPGKGIFVTNGVMNFTSTNTDNGFAAIPRTGPLLPTTHDWSLKIDAHLNPFSATAPNQYTDVFLGVGKTSDLLNTHIIFEFDRAEGGYDTGDDIRIDGVDMAGIFNHIESQSPDVALRMDYSSGNQTITFYFDGDGVTNGYNWAWPKGVAHLAFPPYNMNLSPTDTFTILLVGSSSEQIVTAGQACLENLEIKMWPVPFTYTTNNATITITGYIGFGGAVSIPSTINNLPVTAIGDQAFYQCNSLSSVSISNGVTSIGNEAFAECTLLMNVGIPNSITNIGNAAFEQCINLNSITIPNSVLSIGYNAFLSCISLTGVTIPSSVTNIGFGAFAWCSGLTSIAVDMANPAYSSIGGVLFDNTHTALIGYPAGRGGNFVIPHGVTSIGEGAFYSCITLTSISIPNGITNIASRAFFSCDGLTNLTIPKSVTSIGDDAFRYASSLAGVYFQGDAPTLTWFVFDPTSTAIVYYLPRTSGWGSTFGVRPTVPWDPTVQTISPDFGVQNNEFGFTITGTANIPIVVEASTNLANLTWIPLQTCTLTNGSVYFIDPNWTNYPARFYRIRSP